LTQLDTLSSSDSPSRNITRSMRPGSVQATSSQASDSPIASIQYARVGASSGSSCSRLVSAMARIARPSDQAVIASTTCSTFAARAASSSVSVGGRPWTL